MRPILFELFGFPVPSYSVAMVLGFALALYTLMRLTPRSTGALEDGGTDRPQVWDLFIVMVVSSILGSKIGHVVFEAPGHKDAAGHTITNVVELLKADPWHWARLGESGYVWYGGMIAALGSAIVYFRRRPRLRAWLYADTFAPAIMLGAFVGRIGCFLAGCCYGVSTRMPWGVKFPDTPGPVHPTQLYDSAAALVLGTILYLRFPKRRFDGEGIALLLMTYPPIRSLTESFRGDADRGAFGPLSTSQAISIPLFVAGAAIAYFRSRAQPSPASPPPPAEAARADELASERTGG